MATTGKAQGPAREPVGLIVGWLAIAAVVVVSFLVLRFFRLTWPASAPLGLAVAVRLMATGYGKRRDSAVSRAVARAAVPYLIALAAVTAPQLWYNLAKSDSASIGWVELSFVDLSERF